MQSKYFSREIKFVIHTIYTLCKTKMSLVCFCTGIYKHLSHVIKNVIKMLLKME